MLLLQMLGVDVENLVQYALLLLRRNELLLAILFHVNMLLSALAAHSDMVPFGRAHWMISKFWEMTQLSTNALNNAPEKGMSSLIFLEVHKTC